MSQKKAANYAQPGNNVCVDHETFRNDNFYEILYIESMHLCLKWYKPVGPTVTGVALYSMVPVGGTA